jgi:hypothetical protein
MRRRSDSPRSKRELSSTVREASGTIRQGGRTSVMFDPPSQEPSRSGRRWEIQRVSGANQFRDVSVR